MAPRQPLEAGGILQRAPFRTQRGDGVALALNIAAHLGDALGAQGRFELDLVDIGGGRHQQCQHTEIEEAHGQPPLTMSVSAGSRGSSVLRSAWRGGAALRSPARSLAERARGFPAISASSGAIGRLVSRRKVGTTASMSGTCRDTPMAWLRSARNVLTIRSSSEWKVTTTSRPELFRMRSAAASAPTSSASSSLTKIRSAWNVRVAG